MVTPRHRSRPYPALAGVAVGMLVVGVLLPSVIDERAEPMAVGTSNGGTTELPGTSASGPAPAGLQRSLEVADAAAPAGGTVAPRRGGTAAGSASSGSGVTRPGPQDQTATGGGDGSVSAAVGPGVTATSIRVGVLLLDLGNLGRVGVGVPGLTPEEQQQAWDAFINDLNERGGIGGRTVEPVYTTYDPLSDDNKRAACLYLTEDQQVFAVFDGGGYSGPAVLCITEEHDTPLMMSGSAGMPQEWYDRSRRSLFSLFQGGARAMRNFAAELDRGGLLDGATVGILGEEGPGHPATLDVLEQAVTAAGHQVAHRSRLSADTGVAPSQVPLEVQQMQAKGVDTVLVMANTIYASQFVQTAQGRGYRPRYFTSDWLSNASDVGAQSMPESYDGALSFTSARNGDQRVDIPETEHATACRQVYIDGTGRDVERGTNPYNTAMYSCVLLGAFESALHAAGSDLTRSGLTSGLFGIGPFPQAYLAPGSFAPGKFDSSDYLRTQRWSVDCRCWLPIDEFRRSAF